MLQSRRAVALAIVISLTLPIGAGAQRETITHPGLRPNAPAYAERGPHPVGTRDLVVGAQTPLDVTMWYPALNPGNVREKTTYPYEIKMDAPPGAVATVSGRALRDAPFGVSADPYPLVALSPGFALGRSSYAWLAEHLASHGFVVLAPEHHERLDPELNGFWQAAFTRPHEVVAVLDYADKGGAGGTLAGLVDTDKVAIVGHSYGGYTALMAAGARFDVAGFEALCKTAREAADPSAWLCDLIAPHIADMAELAGLGSVPDGLWPSWGDARVDAIVSMVGDAYLFGQKGLAKVTVPVLALGGTGDTGTPYGWGTRPTFEHVGSSRKVEVALENAEHMIFAATCKDLPWYLDMGLYKFCSDPVWDMERAHDLVGHFTTAFLLAELKRDADAAAALAPGADPFPGVTYKTQGF